MKRWCGILVKAMNKTEMFSCFCWNKNTKHNYWFKYTLYTQFDPDPKCFFIFMAVSTLYIYYFQQNIVIIISSSSVLYWQKRCMWPCVWMALCGLLLTNAWEKNTKQQQTPEQPIQRRRRRTDCSCIVGGRRRRKILRVWMKYMIVYPIITFFQLYNIVVQVKLWSMNLLSLQLRMIVLQT